MSGTTTGTSLATAVTFTPASTSISPMSGSTTGTTMTTTVAVTSASTSMLSSTASSTGTCTLYSRITHATNVKAVSSEETNFLRFSNLMFKRTPKALRMFFDSKHPSSALVSDLAANKVNLIQIKGSVIKQHQWDILFPKSGSKVLSTNFDVTLLICLLRNMTPKIAPPSTGFDFLPSTRDTSEGADLARIKYYRNLLAHTTDGKLSDKDLNDYWKDMEQTLFRLGGSSLLSEVQNLRVATLDDLDKEVMLELGYLRQVLQDTIPWNVRNQIKSIVQLWLDDDQVFVETKATENVSIAIKKHRCVTVVGNPGSGKSATIRHVALQLMQEGYDIIPVRCPEDIFRYGNEDFLQIFVIDDPCGENCVELQSIRWWKKQQDDIPILMKVRDKKDKPKCRILVSCRLAVHNSSHFKDLYLFQECVIHLHDPDNKLSLSERTQIFKSHLCQPRTVSNELLMKHDCFPLLCKLLSRSKLDQNIFLKNPFQVYACELNNLKNNTDTDGPYQYCALVCCVIFEERLTSGLFNKGVEGINKIILEEVHEACELNYGSDKKKTMRGLENQCGVYVNKTGEYFHIIHTTLRDIIAWHFCRDSTDSEDIVVKYAPSILISDRIRPLGRLPDDDETDNYLIELRSTDVFIERIVNDIRTLRFRDVFDNANFPNSELEENICYRIRQNEDIAQMLTCPQKERKEHIENFRLYNERSILESCPSNFIHWAVGNGWFSFLTTVNHSDFTAFRTFVIEQRESLLFLSLFGGNLDLISCFNSICRENKNQRKMCFMCEMQEKENYLHHQNECPCSAVGVILIPCLTGNMDVLRYAFENNLCAKRDINTCFYTCKDQTSPLCAACDLGHSEIVDYLCTMGADVNVFAKNDQCPLAFAISEGYENIVKTLVEHGAKVDIQDDDGWTPLMTAIFLGYENIVQCLLSSEPNVNIQNKMGETPLVIACSYGNEKIVSDLLVHGADVNLQNNKRESPLHLACGCGHIQIVALLLSNNADVNVKNNCECSPIFTAVTYGRSSIVSMLLNHGADINDTDEDGYTPLHNAIFYGNKKSFDICIALNANVDIPGCNEISPLQTAIGQLEECVPILLEKNAKVNAKNEDGYTALHMACTNNQEKTVQLLLSHNVDVNIKNKKEESPMHIAACNGDIKILLYLVYYGGNTEDRDSYGNTALHISCANGNINVVCALLKFEANINARNEIGDTPLHSAIHGKHQDVISHLILQNADVNIENKQGITPLLAACKNGDSNCVRNLLIAGANPNFISTSGLTPIHQTIEHYHISPVKVLVEHGCDINMINLEGKSVIHLVSEKGFDKALEALLSLGADHKLKDKNGKTGLILATENGYEKILSLLLNHDPNLINTQETLNAMSIACYKDHDKIVSLLLIHGINIIDIYFEKSPLMLATERGSKKSVKALLQHNVPFTDMNATLHVACSNGYNDIVAMLLERGACVNEVYSDKTPLMLATGKGHENTVNTLLRHSSKKVYTNNELHIACSNDYDKIVSLLLDYGVSVNQVKNDKTPLLIATEMGCVNSVKALLEHGSEKVDTNTVLHTACFNGYDKIISLLLDYGADINRVDHGKTPLIIATERGHVNSVKALLEQRPVKVDTTGALCTACSQNYDKIVQLLLHYGANVNQLYNGKTPLMVAVEMGHLNSVLSLLQHSTEQVETTTVLLTACSNDNEDLFLSLIRYTAKFNCMFNDNALLKVSAENGHACSVLQLLEFVDTQSIDLTDILHENFIEVIEKQEIEWVFPYHKGIIMLHDLVRKYEKSDNPTIYPQIKRLERFLHMLHL